MKKRIRIILLTAACLAGIAATRADAADYRFHGMWPGIKQPWYFNLPQNAVVDPDGYVYIADTGSDKIQKFTADGAFVTSWAVPQPFGVAADRRGFIYVVLLNGVLKYTSAGELINQWPAAAGSVYQTIEVDGRDWVYVADTGRNCIHVTTTDGVPVGRWGEKGGGEGQFQHPSDIAADNDGNIYVTDPENHAVQKFAVDLKGSALSVRFLRKWGEKGEGPGQFNHPFGIASGRDGVYVVDMLNDRVQKFSFDGRFLLEWGNIGTAEGQFYGPAGICIDAFGSLYVTGPNTGRIQKFTADGRFMAGWQSSGSGPGRFKTPYGIALDDAGQLYVLDTLNHRVQKFSSEGDFLKEWGGRGDGDTELNQPLGIAVHANRVYVADTLNDRVQVFSTDGTPVDRWGGTGPAEVRMNRPSAVAVDPAAGMVYVADTDHHRIQKWDVDGNYLDQWGKSGNGEGEFFFPHGIATGSGFIFVTEKENSRVQKFDLDGNYLAQWGGPGSENGQFAVPYGMDAARRGIFVADQRNHRIQVFDEDGNWTGTWGGFGSLPGRLNGPSDVAVAADGRVYVVDSDNHRIQVFRENTSPLIEKAILVAAGGPYEGNQLWPATQALTNLGYLTLMHQGFSGNTVQYLSPDRGLDLDGDRDTAEVDAEATNAELKSALTEWAADADRLVLYITDHGKTGTLRMNAEETLSAELLDQWLDNLQQNRDVEVVLIYDACYSGSFIENLLPPEGKSRIVITSTSAGEDAYFIGQGSISFSSLFWPNVLAGKNLEAVFQDASSGMDGLQHPQIDADGDGQPGQGRDLEIARGIIIGNGTDMYAESPVVASFTVSTASDTGRVTLTATGVRDPDGVARVWATVAPPDFEPSEAEDSVLELPSVLLRPTGEGEYQAEYSNFSRPGPYTFRLYAKDRLGSTTVMPPRSFDFGQALRRRAILVAGYSPSPEDREAIAELTELARSALVFQGYEADQEIQVLGSQADHPAADGPATISGMEETFKSWAAADTRSLLVWIIGDGKDGAVRLNPDESLNAETLAGWLGSLEEIAPETVTALLDFDGAGAWIPRLSKGAAGKRILMAAAPQDRAAVLQGGGAVSFSGFFWRSVLKGENGAAAFRDARDGLRLVAGVGRENGPVLEADGDGIGNEWEDHRYAADLTIGAGIRLTADAPISNSVSAPKTVAGNSAVTLRVEDVVTAGTMDRVWAVITPPDSGMGIADGTPMETVLTEVQPGIYEGTHDRWPWYGPYGITIFGKDTDGALTRLQETEVFRTDGEDVYEDDSTPDRYPIYVVNHPEPLHRSFHSDTDLDGVLFHAAAGEIYTLQVRQPGSGCDIRMEILDVNGDIQAEENSAGPGGEERLPWRCPKTGVYSVRLTNQHSSGGVDAGYEFSIDRETGAFFGYLRGRIQDAVTGRPLPLAQVRTTAAGTALSRYSGSFLMFHQPGSFDITISAPGYEPMTLPATAVSEGGSTVLDIELQPEPRSPPPVNPPVVPDAFPQAVIRSPAGPLNIQVGGSVSFEGAISSGDPPFQFEWDFSGAAETSTLQNPPPVLFEEPGSFRITFAATDADGDRSEASVMITVTEKTDVPPVPEPDTAPAAAIVSPAGDVSLVQGESVRFAGSADGGNGILTYRWTFDGAAEDSIQASPGEVVFTKPGSFTIKFSVTDQDGDSDTAEMTVTVTPKIPTPGLSEPASGDTNIPLGARLFAAADTDPPNGAFHTATRWQIAHDPGFLQPVLDRITDLHLTALTLPDLLLSTGRDYFWRVQFEFEDGSVSEWSDSGRFVTVAADPKDADADGIADDQMVTEKDLGTPPANAICIRVETGGSVVCLTPVDNVAAVEGLRGFSESEIPDQLNRPQFLPMGLLSMRLQVIDPNEPAILRIDFMRPVTADVGWHGYDPWTGWHSDPDTFMFHSEQSGVRLTLFDGGDQDLDGIQNGIIVHSSGPGTAPAASSEIEFEGPEDSVGGGCFVQTAEPDSRNSLAAAHNGKTTVCGHKGDGLLNFRILFHQGGVIRSDF